MERKTIAGAAVELGKIARGVHGRMRPGINDHVRYLMEVLEWALRAHVVLSELDATAAPTPEQELEWARRINALLDCD